MLDLTVAVPVPLALFILTLTLFVIGFIRTKQKDIQTFWIVLGFCEINLAFILFVGIPAVFYLDPRLETLFPSLFSLVSLFAVLGATLLILRQKV